MKLPTHRRLLPILMMLALLTGCASTGDPRDPLEPMNRAVYKFNDVVDKAVTKPIAQGYRAVLPTPVRNSVTNFFSNIEDILVMFNNLLQFKLNAAGSDFSRIVFNTTFGIGGLFDVATGWGMPKHNEDFGQTLGYWGMGDGAYLVLPLLGPSNVRDSVGLIATFYLDPVWHAVDNTATRNILVGTRFVDRRARLLDAEKVLDEAALDAYSFMRDSYIQYRRNLIYDGNPPREKLEDDPPAPAKKTDAGDAVAPIAAATPTLPREADATAAQEAAAPATETLQTGSGLFAFLFRGGDAAGRQE